MTTSGSTEATTVLDVDDWNDRRDRHRARVASVIGPILDRRAAGVSHPVQDFLFTYYSYRPNQLRRWHPGYGYALTGSGANDYLRYGGYVADGDTVTVGPDMRDRRLPTVRFVRDLLRATADRPANLGCFGLHEWAMVYRTDDDTIRHEQVPLRLGHDGTDEVVESMNLRCTHYDAFRFFTDGAAHRNVLPLERSDQIEREQPGCLHAGMDLYKWAYKLAPLVDSDVIMDCFEHTLRARELDMRASPYDLMDYGYEPIAIETPAGRAEYVRRQTELADTSAVLRASLLERCRVLLDP
ncbi:3-methyladenine DNA glycosylase [Rhodococcus sp. NPDC058521]|uniref:3-methyladenine DNA glycosylase n=1 Tax=Rhodococcus sp. NPDC058521 TaxID=3346536 RepID=UPI003666698F